MMKRLVLAMIAIGLLAGMAFAELTTNVAALQEFAERHTAKWESWRGPEYEAAKQATSGFFGEINADPNKVLVGIKPDGTPVIATLRNVNAALTTRATAVQPGGVAGYDLDGSTTTGLYHWDGSAANPNHQEFVGRVTIGDGAGSGNAHASHTAGTMMASGVEPNAMGMASGAFLTSYDWDNDQAEMAIAATEGMKVSNHSYGFGDSFNGGYDEWAAGYDEIVWNAPHYLPVIAAGNLGSGSFGSLYTDVCGKNSLAVGNVLDVVDYQGPNSVNVNSSSSVGPTDDGRVKPDIVGNGTDLYSCNQSGYTTMTGTSMASPNIAGSLFLLYELYEQTHAGEVPWSSTIKGLMINTADEAGPNPGPDYKYGYGLMNTTAACDLIAEDEVLNPNSIMENTLFDGATDVFSFTSDGTQPLKATIAWIEPPSELWADTVLINDLDMVIEGPGGMYLPWTLDGNNPSAPAVPGDNDVDNNEVVFIENPEPGQYTIIIDHEGDLLNGEQPYSLIVSGAFGGEAPQYVVYLDPIWNYVMPGGGELRYNVRVMHNRDFAVPGLTFWTEVILPNGSSYGPVYQQQFTAQPWMNVEVFMTQDVPGWAPGGVYQFIANVGFFPTPEASDSFEMVKFFQGDWGDGARVTEWAGAGFENVGRDLAGVTNTMPEAYELREAYPNPFNPTTSISVALPEASELSVQVFNTQGRLVKTLAKGRRAAGEHSLTFDGSGLASGVYFVKAFVPGELNATRKLVLMK